MLAHNNYLEQKVEPDGECLSVFQATLLISMLIKNLQVTQKVQKLVKFTANAFVT